MVCKSNATPTLRAQRFCNPHDPSKLPALTPEIHGLSGIWMQVPDGDGSCLGVVEISFRDTPLKPGSWMQLAGHPHIGVVTAVNVTVPKHSMYGILMHTWNFLGVFFWFLFDL